MNITEASAAESCVKKGRYKMKIGFIGLGKLGLPIAEEVSKTFEVTGYDIRHIESEILKVSSDFKDVVTGKDIIFVAVQTPHDERYGGQKPSSHLEAKDFKYENVLLCLKEIQNYRSGKEEVVLISTVLPGTIRSKLSEVLPDLVYNPFLIAMGTEVWDFLNPEMVIIGTRNGDRAERLLDFYEQLLKTEIYRAEGTWEEAESIKVFYNTFISFKISLVNMIQDVSQNLGHMNVDVVTKALASSKMRLISEAYMKAGMGDGGPCHPRDNIALSFLSEKLELGYDLFGSISQSREGQAKNLAVTIKSYGQRVCILGKSYKPHTSLVDGSYSVLLQNYLEDMGAEVTFYDPKTGDNLMPESKVDVYLISFHESWVEDFEFQKGSIVVDPWRKFKPREGIEVVSYGNTRE